MVESKRNPVTLFIDEFETMASGTFGSIIAEGRRFGLSLVLSHQNLSQLGSELRQVIRGNVHVQLFFQTGSSDASDLASDISLQDSKDNIRQALISQAVGEAFVVRRGLPSIQVVTPISPDPPVDSSTVRAFKLEALEAHCLPVSECDNDQKRSSTRSSILSTPEVRHEKLPKTREAL
jgi:DNA helicase HerA-like ATPase